MSSTIEDRPVDEGSVIRKSDENSAWLMFVTFLSVVALALGTVAMALWATDGGGGSDAGGAAAGGGGGPASDKLDVTATDFQFDPASWSAPADTELTVNLTNDGPSGHNFAILPEPIESSSDFDEGSALLVLGDVTAGVAPGESESGTVTLVAGTYQYVCTVPGHLEAGMQGEVTVQ